MFDFKVGKKIKSPKNFNNHKRPKKNNNCFHPLVREQSICNKFYKKRGFFSSALLSFLLMSGSVTANLDGDFNINGSDISIGGLGNTTGILNIHERYGVNDTTAINTGESLTCDKLNNESTRKLCKEFTAPGSGYRIHFLGKDESIREYNSNTVYIVPPGEFQFEDVIKITNAKNVAIIGEAGLDGENPTLKGSNKSSTMLKWEDCERCLLANINIDPTTENNHSLPVYVSGRKTEMEFRNISATHSRTGLLVVSSANSIILENVGTSFEPENRHKIPSILRSSAIYLHNCSKIKAKDVWVYDVFLDPNMAYRHVIDILNPEDIDFDGIYIGLTKNSISDRDMAYIGLAFSNMEKYSRAGGNNVVNALMKGLHLGVYTGGETGEHVTVPEDWPVNRHILNLSERTSAPSDTTKITGQVAIETNDDIQLIANKPGVQKVSGEDLFYNLKVIFSGLISPITTVSTTNSSFIPNSTSSPGFLVQKGGDNSDMSTLEITTAVGGPVLALVFIVISAVAYKKRAAVRAFFAGSMGTAMYVSYKAAQDTEYIVGGQSDDGVYGLTTEQITH